MSTLVVEVCEVKAVYPHPNADALEFVTVKGWQVIVQKALGMKPGDRVVYFPPDTVMPPELAERLGIAKYLAPLPREIDGSRRPGLRVRAARLRGQPSYGTIDHAVDPAWEVGRDVKDYYGVIKFEPPVRPTDGDALPPLAAFHRYTEIENIRNFPDVLMAGEEVVITEKLHGKNCRLGLVRVARPEVVLVLLAIRWWSHSFGDVKRYCERHGKPMVRLPGGYGVNQVAAQILAQCGGQLGAG